MSLRDTIRVIQPGRRRLKIFVDFWNVVINAQKQTSDAFNLEVRWDELASLLVSQTRPTHGDDTSGDLAGCYIFGSYKKSDAKKSKIIDGIVDAYGSEPGLFFTFTELQKKETSVKCSNCGNETFTLSEAGVDISLSVEMIKHALMREHEYLALASNDRDFLPLLSYLKDRGERVLHAATDAAHRDMRSITWKQVKLKDYYTNICRLSLGQNFILTTPSASEWLAIALTVLGEAKENYRIIDITQEDQISTQDLKFLISVLNMMFERHTERGRTFGWANIGGSISKIRTGLLDGSVRSSFPYVVRDGVVVARSYQNSWVVPGNDELAAAFRQAGGPRQTPIPA